MKPIFVNINDNISKINNNSEILTYITSPEDRYGQNLDDEGYDYFYQSISQLENQDIITVCMGELYE